MTGAEVIFSHESGAYSEDPIELILENPSGHEIVYTTDGSLPTIDSARFSKAIKLDSRDSNPELIRRLAKETPGGRTLLVDATLPTATVIRAAVVLADGTVGRAFTNTYFVGQDLGSLYGDIMVASIVADPYDLLDYETGIMAAGAIYDQHREENEALDYIEYDYLQANYMQRGRDWERCANLELFDGANCLSYEAPCGIRLHGNYSRSFAQKSFNIYFRGSYGMSHMDYDLFDGAQSEASGLPISSFKSFCLRSGGNSTEMMRFKDSFLQQQVADRRVSTLTTRPAVAYLNGEFYGVYNLNEHYSKNYVESHYGVSKDNVVMFEDGFIDEGIEEDLKLYYELIQFCDRDLSDASTWDEFCSVVDVQSMADFYAIELYISNWDFNEWKNYRVWRSREPEGGSEYGDARWRWMLNDLDISAGMYGNYAISAGYDNVGVCLKNCALFASAMHNPSFRELMRECLVDLSEGAFEPDRVLKGLDDWWNAWRPLIELSNKRFNTDMEDAESELSFTKEFFAERDGWILYYYDLHAAEYEAAEG